MPIFFRKGRSKSEADAHTSSRSKAESLFCGRAASLYKPLKVSTLRCPCCGTTVAHGGENSTFKCTVCSVTTSTVKQSIPADSFSETTWLLSLSVLHKVVDTCYSKLRMSASCRVEDCREAFDPVSDYLSYGFQDIKVLQNSFSPAAKHELVDLKQLSEFYKLILTLPTRKPLYRMLRACRELLRKPVFPPEDIKWIFIIWLNPTIRQSLISKGGSACDSPQIRSVSYEIAKRCVGYLSNIPIGPGMNKLLHYLKYMPDEEFRNQIEIVNLYITLQMTRILQKNQPLNGHSKVTNDREFFRDKDVPYGDSFNMIPGNRQIKVYEYAKNWRIRCAANLMAILYIANNKRGDYEEGLRLGSSEFYNMMFDFVDYKQDFFIWRQQSNNSSGTVGDAIGSEPTECKISLCNYPFLLSIGVKRMIMDLETKLIMTTEAEQAFLSSLDSRQVFQVTLRVRVRRSNIVEDSLRCIKNHTGDLMKQLKVQFVDEPGVDAGGLSKEWFSLLTESLVGQEKGLFSCVEESGYSWFSCRPMTNAQKAESNELYFLFGTVIALAVFNGTILNLRLPSCFYRKLCKEPLTFRDYERLYPETASNLKKMLAYDEPDFAEVFALTFETTSQKKTAIELCHNGRHRRVTGDNKTEFVQLWTDYHLNKSIDTAFRQLFKGFRQVFLQSQSVRLFNSSELEQLLCGSRERNCYDFQTLRSVAKYSGGFTDKCQTIEWFWDVLQEWDIALRRKLLIFTTGSDRVPSTGICTLTFKICRIGPHDSEKLPVAHTCFNEICLWDYSSKAKLEDKLWWAVTQSEGFDLK